MKFAYKIKLLSLYIFTFIFCSCVNKNNDGEFVAYFGGEIVNPNNPYVLFCKDNIVIDSLKLDSNNRFFIKFDSLAPGMYSFKHEPEYQYVYFDKNDSIMVRVNSRDFDNSVAFCGRGDLKNTFLMDLYLRNEKDKNSMFKVFDYGLEEFTKTIDSSNLANEKFYQLKKQEIKWSEDFDVFAKAAVNFQYYTKKELYPNVHKIRTGNDVFEQIPSNYYDYRKKINFDNAALENYAPFVMYLSHMLNNMGAINYHNHFTEADLALKTNINKMQIADTLIKNEKLKNIMLDNIAFTYFLEDQNMVNNKAFLESYHKFSTDKSKQNEIAKIGNAIQQLRVGNALPNVILIDSNGNKLDSDSFKHKKTVIYFWTGSLIAHFEAVHKKILKFKQKYPNFEYIAINLNDSQDDWLKILKSYQLTGITQLRCDNFEDIKSKWAINKIHRTIILDENGKIKNAFTNIFDTTFENNFK
ncbi:MAG TPA: thioredoxin-like domain-containing protein [Flavobacterium sp.]|jgi:peroxiredoxin|uniref:TlpA family protein disulfide reductase n=1 Tax=Flavobacterium sp. TaxID=239 RepID=UPI002B50EC1C|nr:thioredoxin-like domain-containing protein [Flavobacterium sp.]HPW98009.1 thioredoxin-like domain-containing protein [Flavobacterium sp.]HQA75003.1 thioredoxin-like domain-containing protein [Flavobacterium sp.]